MAVIRIRKLAHSCEVVAPLEARGKFEGHHYQFNGGMFQLLELVESELALLCRVMAHRCALPHSSACGLTSNPKLSGKPAHRSRFHRIARNDLVLNVPAIGAFKMAVLRMHYLIDADLPLTQEFLAEMMGVRRTSVTAVAGDLQKQRLITYRRGLIHINDLEQLRQHACECSDAIHSHHRKIFAPEQPTSLSVDPKMHHRNQPGA